MKHCDCNEYAGQNKSPWLIIGSPNYTKSCPDSIHQKNDKLTCKINKKQTKNNNKQNKNKNKK